MLIFAISAIFGAWLGLSVIFQFVTPSPRWVKHHGLFPKHVIPKWTFFAPSPGTVDYRVVFQDYRTEDEPIGGVREIPLHVNRSLLHAVWNPEKRRRKAIFDITQLLQQMQETPLERPNVGIQTTTPYLALLNIVMAIETRAQDAHFRRFLLVYTRGFEGDVDPLPVFVSSFHPFGNTRANA
jgi:hypothetical protein